MSRVYLLDTETTSHGPGREVIELAWIRLRTADGAPSDLIPDELTEAESFVQRYKPEWPIAVGSLAVHHILPSELEGCPPSASAALPVDAGYVIGHTVDFDWESVGSPAHVKRIDTCAMARHLWPDADSHSQAALLYLLEGARPETREALRGALVDARNNLVLLRHIVSAKPEITTWRALWEYSEFARIPTIMPLGRNRGAPIAQLDSGEIRWYLERDFIDAYLRKAFEQEIARRGEQVVELVEGELESEPF
jgi:exodeoxyribonuclease X